MYDNVDSFPSDSFWTQVSYKGAFGPDPNDMWISSYSRHASNDQLADTSSLPYDGSANLCGTIYADVTLSASVEYKLNCQVFVKNGATLTIEAGTVIKAKKVDAGVDAPALIIEQGAMIMAKGTAKKPITFTAEDTFDPTADNFDATKARGLWGGLIILG